MNRPTTTRNTTTSGTNAVNSGVPGPAEEDWCKMVVIITGIVFGSFAIAGVSLGFCKLYEEKQEEKQQEIVNSNGKNNTSQADTNLGDGSPNEKSWFQTYKCIVMPIVISLFVTAAIVIVVYCCWKKKRTANQGRNSYTEANNTELDVNLIGNNQEDGRLEELQNQEEVINGRNTDLNAGTTDAEEPLTEIQNSTERSTNEVNISNTNETDTNLEISNERNINEVNNSSINETDTNLDNQDGSTEATVLLNTPTQVVDDNQAEATVHTPTQVVEDDPAGRNADAEAELRHLNSNQDQEQEESGNSINQGSVGGGDKTDNVTPESKEEEESVESHFKSFFSEFLTTRSSKAIRQFRKDLDKILKDFNKEETDKIASEMNWSPELTAKFNSEINANLKVTNVLDKWAGIIIVAKAQLSWDDKVNNIKDLVRSLRGVRDDVITEIRKHVLKGIVGTKRDPTTQYTDLPYSIQYKLSEELNMLDDEKCSHVAEKLCIGEPRQIQYVMNQSKPGRDILRSWETKADATVGRLYDVLMHCGATNVAAMLE